MTSGSLTLLSLQDVTAQTPPAETYKPGFWQPVARVDLDRPITIKLMNESELGVDYAITEVKMTPILIPANETITLENIEPSIYLVIYPSSNNPDNSRIYLQYEVHVTKENIVEVKIRTTDDGNKSHRTFNLQNTGAIYLY
jgi:hypothetical protein